MSKDINLIVLLASLSFQIINMSVIKILVEVFSLIVKHFSYYTVNYFYRDSNPRPSLPYALLFLNVECFFI